MTQDWTDNAHLIFRWRRSYPFSLAIRRRNYKSSQRPFFLRRWFAFVRIILVILVIFSLYWTDPHQWRFIMFCFRCLTRRHDHWIFFDFPFFSLTREYTSKGSFGRQSIGILPSLHGGLPSSDALTLLAPWQILFWRKLSPCLMQNTG